MAAKVLYIEIGDCISKVCRANRKGKVCQIEKAFLFRTPDGTVTDGFISDPEKLSETLLEKLKENDLGGPCEAVFTLTSGRVATREVTLPPVKDNRIQELVQTNAADYFPVDMSGYEVTYTLLQRIKGEEPGVRVLVIAAPTTLIQTYVQLADACSMKIQAIDFSGNSQFHALRPLSGEGVTMYVNIDCNSTYCSFIRDGNLLLQRTFAFGGADLVNAYLTSAGRPATDFLDALLELNDPKCDKISEEDAGDMLERLISSIVRGGDFFTSTQDASVEQIVLMGPCAHLPHVCHLIASGSGTETVYLEETSAFSRLTNAVESAAFYISCIGSSVAPVDLLPEDYKSRKKKKSSASRGGEENLKGGIVICAVCVAASLVLCATSVLGYLSQRRQLDAIQSRISELGYVEDIYNTYVSYSAAQDGLKVVSDAARGYNAALETFFTELEQNMPSEILLLTANCTGEGVTMDVTVPGYKEAAVVISQLRDFDSIDAVQVGGMTETADGAGVTRVSFSVSCLYPVPEEPAAQTDAAAGAAASTGAAAGTEG